MNLDPTTTAVVTMEMQRGVCGDLAALPHLRDAVRERGIVPNVARLLADARAAGASVVHCTVVYRADRRNTPTNAPLFSALNKRGESPLVAGSPGVELLAELGPDPTDLIEARSHGISPFGGTSLDATLRAIGATTLVAVGASVNLGIFGLVVEAVNHGYRVVVPRDAVVGVPPDYGDQVLEGSVGLLATLSSVDALIGAWVNP